MEKNVGTKDKWIRLIMSLLLLPILFMVKGPARWIGLLSIPLLGTALMNKCGLYAVLGLSTCEIDK